MIINGQRNFLNLADVLLAKEELQRQKMVLNIFLPAKFGNFLNFAFFRSKLKIEDEWMNHN